MTEERNLSHAKTRLLEEWRAGRLRPNERIPDADDVLVATALTPLAPCSFFQEYLWNSERTVGPSAVWSISYFAWVDAALDQCALATAIEEMGWRHETLRTTIIEINGVPHQRIADAPTVHLEVQHLSDHALPQAEQHAVELATTSLRQPFDVDRGPLARTILYILDDEHCALCMVAHHIIADGWSLAVGLHELADLYDAFSSGLVPQRDATRANYRDFAKWHRKWMRSPQYDRKLDYWRSQLQDVGLNTLNPGTDAAPEPSLGAHFPTISIGTDLSGIIRDFSRREDASLFMTLLSALAIVVHDVSGETDVLIGTPVANRPRPETHDMIGLFSNTLALRVDLRGNPTFSTLLRRVRKMCLSAFANQEVTVPMYLEAVEPGRDLIRDPLYTVTLVLQPRTPEFSLAGVPLRRVELDPAVGFYELAFHLWDEENVRGHVEHSAACYATAKVSALIERFCEVLRLAAAEPETEVDCLLAAAHASTSGSQ
jgi:Non-ribosomal peptide synthetase modules and related proteins